MRESFVWRLNCQLPGKWYVLAIGSIPLVFVIIQCLSLSHILRLGLVRPQLRDRAAAAWPGRYFRMTRASTAIASSGRAEIGLRSTSCARCKNYCRHRPRPGRFAALCALRSRRRDRRQCSWRHTHGIGRIGIEHTAIVIAGPGACGMRASSVRRRPGLRQRGIAGNVSTGDFDRHADPDSKDES